jgi:hypothetical protein
MVAADHYGCLVATMVGVSLTRAGRPANSVSKAPATRRGRSPLVHAGYTVSRPMRVQPARAVTKGRNRTSGRRRSWGQDASQEAAGIRVSQPMPS